MNSEKISKVEAAYVAASGSWSGLDWTYLVPPTGGCSGSSAYDIDGLDLDDPATAERWTKSLLDDAPEMSRNRAKQHVEAALDVAREYIAKVERDAAAAEEAAKYAIEAVKDGNLDAAIEYATAASSIENEYGDDPVWGSFRRAVIELVEDREE